MPCGDGVPPYTGVCERLDVAAGTPACERKRREHQSFLPARTVIAGIPTTAGAYSFDLIATDAARRRGPAKIHPARTSPGLRLIGATAHSESGHYRAPRSTRSFVAVWNGTGLQTFSTTAPSVRRTAAARSQLRPLRRDRLAGTTTSTGSYTFNLRVQDMAGNTTLSYVHAHGEHSLGLASSTSNPAHLWVGGGLNGELDLDVNGSSTYTWTHTWRNAASGSSPCDQHRWTEQHRAGRAPTAPGIFTFTLRATDNANAANFAEHVFTVHVAPMQIALAADRAPGGFHHRFAVGPCWRAGPFTLNGRRRTPPYTYAQSPLVPLPQRLYLELDRRRIRNDVAYRPIHHCAGHHRRERTRCCAAGAWGW